MPDGSPLPAEMFQFTKEEALLGPPDIVAQLTPSNVPVVPFVAPVNSLLATIDAAARNNTSTGSGATVTASNP